MTDTFIFSPAAGRRIALVVVLGLGGVSAAHAQRGAHGGHERFARQPAHFVLDSRFHHNHYYPARGFVVNALPPGYLDIGVGRGRFFFNAGVWYRPVGTRYVVVAPPPGVFVPALPPAYTTIWIGSTPYYYANNVYYTSAPGGYSVVAPPPAHDAAPISPPPPDMPPPGSDVAPTRSEPAPGIAGGLFVYPGNGQSARQTARDQAECEHWASGQTGYDLQRDPSDDNRLADFQRAEGACLEGRGYIVK